MIQGSKGQKAVHACMIRLLNLGPAKHEKAAVFRRKMSGNMQKKHRHEERNMVQKR